MCVYATEKTMRGTNIWLLCDWFLHPLYRNSCYSVLISESQVAEFNVKLKAFDNTK